MTSEEGGSGRGKSERNRATKVVEKSVTRPNPKKVELDEKDGVGWSEIRSRKGRVKHDTIYGRPLRQLRS